MGIEEWVELGGEVWAELEGLGLGMRLGCLGGLTLESLAKQYIPIAYLYWIISMVG